MQLTFLWRDAPSGYVPAHNNLKVIPPVLNHFNISEFENNILNFKYFSEISHRKNKAMNKKTTHFVEVNCGSSHWNIFLEIGLPIIDLPITYRRRFFISEFRNKILNFKNSVSMKSVAERTNQWTRRLRIFRNINQLFHKGSSKNSNQGFSYLLQFMKIFKNTPQNIFYGC